MKMRMNDTKTNRLPYQKPLLEKVTLVAEEAVLTACKTSSSGPGRPSFRCSAGPPWQRCRNTVGS